MMLYTFHEMQKKLKCICVLPTLPTRGRETPPRMLISQYLFFTKWRGVYRKSQGPVRSKGRELERAVLHFTREPDARWWTPMKAQLYKVRLYSK